MPTGFELGRAIRDAKRVDLSQTGRFQTSQLILQSVLSFSQDQLLEEKFQDLASEDMSVYERGPRERSE